MPGVFRIVFCLEVVRRRVVLLVCPVSQNLSFPDKSCLQSVSATEVCDAGPVFVRNYIERHQNRANQVLHLVGVPVTFIVPWIIFSQTSQDWRWFWACFVCGYILQFVGHAIEGNDAGEVCLIKKNAWQVLSRVFAPATNRPGWKQTPPSLCHRRITPHRRLDSQLH